ncbi:DNA-binding response regulator [Cyclobacteriaceae bacterium YHN15]|jgi:DNA-binding NarL/FixJ family response regulator|nr:DNA-binding response regulator [Cyclobacteriaceae bacterium YHN15]
MIELMPAKIKIVHIDDHLLFVQGVFSLLSEEATIEWLGSATSIKEGLSLCEQFRPKVVLLDYFLPDGNGLHAAQQIIAMDPSVLIIMLSMESNPYVIEKCREAGVMGFLPKSIDRDKLMEAILSATKGKTSFPELKNAPKSNVSMSNKLDVLSKREKEIALLISEGLTSAQISEKLFLSLLTVNTHRRNLLNKLNLNNTAQLSALISLAVNTEEKNKK